jgi:small-conductance mechanosensitive channel
MASATLGALPGLAFIAVLAAVVRFVLRLTRLFFDAVQGGSIALRNFEAEWAPATFRIVRLAILAFAVVIAYPYIPGSDSGAFKGVSILLGVLFSLGSSSFLSNIVAGHAMTYRRAFRVGDCVKIGDALGQVIEMRVLVTHLRTFKNEEVIIPNSTVLTSNVTNYTRAASEHGLTLHLTVGIGYETPWRQVEAMLLIAASRTEGILESPKPYVLERGLGDFCVTYEINVFVRDALRMLHTLAALQRNVLDVFNEYGVQIMTPAYEADPQAPKLVPKDHWFDAPAVEPDGGRRKVAAP